MIHLASASVRRPVVALVVWLLVVVALGIVGRNLDSETSPTIFAVPGTESEAAQQFTESEFGDTTLVPILLEGPEAAIDKQGPGVVRELRGRRDTRILSPWDESPGVEALRPNPNAAAILAAVERSREDVVAKVQDQIEEQVAATTTPPVVGRVTGQAAVDQALADEAVNATRNAVLISLPLIFLLLLIGFRSPVAAVVCTVLAASVLPVTYGALTIAAQVVEIDAVAAAIGSMVGLALTTAFAALIVARFREEIHPHADARENAVAATASVGTAGRTVLLAATAMVVAMTLASMLGPTEVLVSVGLGATLATAIGASFAVGIGSAILALLGNRIDAGSFGHAAPATAAAVPIGERLGRIGRHPATIAGIALVALLALVGPVLDWRTGEPDVSTLPADNKARQDYEAFQRAMGEGATSPFEITVVNKGTAITTREMLKRVDRWEQQLARDKRIDGVVGPGPIAEQAEELQGIPKGLKTAAETVAQSQKDLPKLLDGLGQAGDGVKQVREGLATAADGASQLDAGAGELNDGAGQLNDGAGQLADGTGQAAEGGALLSDGLDTAAQGSVTLSGFIGQASDGATELADGSVQLRDGSKTLADGLSTADTTVKNGLPLFEALATNAQAAADHYGPMIDTARRESDGLTQALATLEQASPGVKADPVYQQLLNDLQASQAAATELNGQLSEGQTGATGVAGGVSTAVGQVKTLSDGLSQLSAGANQLNGGLVQLSSGSSELSAGMKQIDDGGIALTDGLGQLSDGSKELAGGLRTLDGFMGQLHAGTTELAQGTPQLKDGTNQLATGLSEGYDKSAPLEDGMTQIYDAVSETEEGLPTDAVKDYKKLRASSPGMFDSGYFTLSAVDGAPHPDQDAARFVVNLDRGGLAARITVTPKWPAGDDRTRALRDDLEDQAAAFAKATGTETAVGGTGAQLQDFRTAADESIPVVIAALLLAGFLILVAVTRGLLVPAIAIALNVLVLGATFGILAFLFGNDHPLGGSGYIDPISAIGIATVVLGLSIDYQLFLLARVREKYDTESLDEATRYGLRSTRFVLTGAAIVMLAVLAAFARSDLVTVREFAVGVAIALLIDATLIRLLLLPIVIKRLGTRGWNLPQKLGDRLPRIHLSPSPAAQRRSGPPVPPAGNAHTGGLS